MEPPGTLAFLGSLIVLLVLTSGATVIIGYIAGWAWTRGCRRAERSLDVQQQPVPMAGRAVRRQRPATEARAEEST